MLQTLYYEIKYGNYLFQTSTKYQRLTSSLEDIRFVYLIDARKNFQDNHIYDFEDLNPTYNYVYLW